MDNEKTEHTKILMAPWKVNLIIFGGLIGYELLIFYIWGTFHEYERIINRFSWSFSDALAMVALGLTVYLYNRSYKTADEHDENTKFLASMMGELRKGGLDPQIVGVLFEAQFGEKVRRLQAKLDEGKVTEDDLIEALRD